jgi:GYF domain 2
MVNSPRLWEGRRFSKGKAMNILFHCDFCSREVHAPPQMSGKQAVCPFCRAVLYVPKTEAMAPHEIREFIDTELADNSLPEEVSSGTLQNQEPAETPASDVLLSVAPAGSRMGRKLSVSGIDPTGSATSGSRIATEKPSGSEVQIPDALWYLRPDSGGQFGPASSVLLKQWKAEGRVGPEAWIWRAGWENWQPASSIFPDLKANPPQVLAEPSQPAKPGSSVVARIKWVRNRRAKSRFLTIALVAGVLVAISLVVVLLIVVGNQGVS